MARPPIDTLSIISAPGFSKAFAPNMILQGEISTLTFSIENSASPVAASGLNLSDNLPAGMTVATPANASTTCSGGTLTATAGTGSVNYSGGAVAAGSSCAVAVDVTALATGAYVNTSGDLTSSLGDSGNSRDTLNVDVQPNGSVTFVQMSATDACFGFTSAEALLNFTITMVGGTGQQGPISVPAGTYTVSYSPLGGLGLSSITCTDGFSTVDMTTGEMTLQIDMAEVLTCTYVSANTGGPTSEAISQFLSAPADLILSNEPDRSRRLNRLKWGTGVEVLRFAPGDVQALLPVNIDPRSFRTGSDNLSTSLADVIRAAAVVDLAVQPEGTTRRVAGNRFDLWFEGAYSPFDGGAGSAGNFAIVYLGADYLVTPDLLVGALVQVDDMTDTTTGAGPSASGPGWMAGP